MKMVKIGRKRQWLIGVSPSQNWECTMKQRYELPSFHLLVVVKDCVKDVLCSSVGVGWRSINHFHCLGCVETINQEGTDRKRYVGFVPDEVQYMRWSNYIGECRNHEEHGWINWGFNPIRSQSEWWSNGGEIGVERISIHDELSIFFIQHVYLCLFPIARFD